MYNKIKPAIADYSITSIKENHHFIRIGTGSLGGKARGLAFAHSIINDYQFLKRFPHINISVPKIVVISTSIFDEFMENNNLWDIALSKNSNKKIEQKFLNATLSKELEKSLKYSQLKISTKNLNEKSRIKNLNLQISTY